MTVRPIHLPELSNDAAAMESVAPPAWVGDHFGVRHPPASLGHDPEAASLEVTEGDGHALVTVRRENAGEMDGERFEQAVRGAYDLLREQVRGLAASHPIRFWNHVPAINQLLPDGRDRYMAFNAGRFAAFSDWYDGAGNFDRHVATASAVGHGGSDLVVHCLTALRAGRAVANPRQVQSFHYSKRFGPVPPCFARATVVKHGKPMMLAGGTASIRGEDTLYRESLQRQSSETFTNLAMLLRTAAGGGESLSEGEALSRYRELRVYVTDVGHAREVVARVQEGFGNLKRVEVRRAALCRPDMLVEIEGIAELNEGEGL